MLEAAGSGRTMPDWLQQRAQTTPDRLALMFDGDDQLLGGTGSWTFGYLSAKVDAVVEGLRELHVGPGDVIGVLSKNRSDFVRVVHALPRLGAALMPLNIRSSADEIAWQLRDARAAWLLHDISTPVMELARQAATTAGIGSSGLQVLDMLSMKPRQPPQDVAFSLDSIHSVIYTSGTTGRPKGAMLTYGNHLWSALGSALNLGLLPDDRWLACLPLFHVGGLSILVKGVIYGMPIVLHETFDAARVNRSIDEDGVTIVSVVAAMLQRMLDERGAKPYPPWLRCLLLGGGPAPEPLLRQCAARGVPVVQTYGLTETASQVATLAPEEALRKLGSAGKALFGSELRILRDDGAVCGPGEAGEIAVRGPTVTPGYLNRPHETAQALRDGWLHTGDAGYRDAEGYLYVLDRRDDLIISGGENVYPAEVEAALAAHPAVLEAGVYGIEDARWGRAPAAVVVLHKGVSATEAELIEHCRGPLARYKTPVRVSFVEALPRNASGKLLRRELAALARPPSG